MNTGFIVLIPTIVVLATAVLARKVLFSLFLGIVTACLIATDFSLIASAKLLFIRNYEQIANYENMLLVLFLIFLGILIEILTHTGCIQLYSNALIKRIRSAKQAQMTSLSHSFFFFIDDYFSALMIGSIMRPIMDHFKKPRAKLAYFINAIGASMAVMIPASSWTGMIIAQLVAQGINRGTGPSIILSVDPFYFYLCMLPFFFFPLMSIISAWYVVARNISFGAMKKFETIAHETGNVFGGKEPLKHTKEICIKEASILDILLPLATFVVVFIITLFASGQYWLLGGTRSFFEAFINAKCTHSLCIASIAGVIVATARYLLVTHGDWKKMASLWWDGFWFMRTSLLLLLFAWSFAYILQYDLQTGKYVAENLLSSLNLTLLPGIIFVVSTLISAGIGSSWGTIMLIMPLIVPVITHLVGQPPFDTSALFTFVPSVAAIIAGSVAGSQLSPISDSTIISSLSSQCYHIDHVQTQIAYSIPVVIGSASAYTLFGFLNNLMPLYAACALALIVGLAITFIIFELQNYKKARHSMQ